MNFCRSTLRDTRRYFTRENGDSTGTVSDILREIDVLFMIAGGAGDFGDVVVGV